MAGVFENPGRGKIYSKFHLKQKVLEFARKSALPGKILVEFHIKLGVGTLAINLLPKKLMVLLGKYTLAVKDPCATEKEAVGVQAFLTYSFDNSSGGGGV